MLLRTHLAFAILLLILFIQQVSDKLVFGILILFAAALPDIDTGFSSWGRHWIFKPMQFFLRHRTLIHSFTFCIVVSIVIAIFFPVASFGFFLGFSSHLLMDSFTKDGIQPFWPLTFKSAGFIKSGGRIEGIIFLTLVAVDILIVVFLFAF